MIARDRVDAHWVDSDSRADALAATKQFVDYVEALAEVWDRLRTDELVAALPVELVDLLDDASDTMLCSTSGCRKRCFEDWDFCEEHGRDLPLQKGDDTSAFDDDGGES